MSITAGTRGPCPFERLPDDLVLSVAQWLDPRSLLCFDACGRRIHSLPKGALWRSLCAAICEALPRYRLTPEREQSLVASVQPDWVARYRHTVHELSRTTITKEELQTLNWHFNFTPAAGGRGRATLVRARFTGSHVVLPNYPPLPYMLHTPEPAEAEGEGRTGGTSGGESLNGGARGGSGGGAATPRTDLPPRPPLLPSLLDHLLSHLHVMDPCRNPSPQCLQINNFPPHWVRRLDDGEWLVYNHNVSFVSCVGNEPGAFDERGFLTVPKAPGESMMEDEDQREQ